MSKRIEFRGWPRKLSGAVGEVDREKGELRGAVVLMTGEAMGHGVMVDGITLDQVVALGRKQEKGVKCRFGHPDLCTSAMGTLLGRYFNFRRDGEYVRADLRFSETASDTPKGDLAGYTMDLAEKEPDMFGNSVVVRMAPEYVLEPDGTRKKDENGEELLPLMRVEELYAVDLVDEPAATEGFFENNELGSRLRGNEGFGDGDEVRFSKRTLVELRGALEKPGFVERMLRIFGRGLNGRYGQDGRYGQEVEGEDERGLTGTGGDVETQEKAGGLEEGQEEGDHEMDLKDLTIEELRGGRPDLAELLEGAGVERERNRVVKILGRCGPAHFEKTKEHEEGFAVKAVKEGTGYEAALEGILDITGKRGLLHALERESQANGVPPAGPGSEGGVTGGMLLQGAVDRFKTGK